MYVLGIKTNTSKYFGTHDAAVALLKDNEIISLIEEERFTRVKHAPDCFPEKAIKHILNENNINISDIDHIALPFQPSEWGFVSDKKAEDVNNEANELILSEFKKIFPNEDIPEISFFNHHKCHAASSFYLSGFENAIVITADGTGERESTVVWEAKNGELKKIHQVNWPHSLGELYATMTGFLGFKPNSGEGKTMGLAAYGKGNSELKNLFEKNIIRNGDHNFEIISDKFVASTWKERYEYIESRLGIKCLEESKREVIEDVYKDIAFQTQSKIEEILLQLLEFAKPHTQSRNLCLAGGLAMNVSMNSELLSKGDVDDIFVQPLAADNGSMLGAAILKYIEISGKQEFERLDHLYYGSSYKNEEIEEILKKRNLNYIKVDNPSKEAAKLLSDGAIIAWFNGRMEAGARALGNRSILSNPISAETKDTVNEIKNREKWRPLAISIMEEYKNEYMEGYIPHCASFMIITRVVKDSKLEKIPSALHIDNTTRPQVVTKKVNPAYHNLINEFYKLTGIPLVMNTSLNDRGEPIVENPDQAIDFFLKSDLNALFLQDFLLTKDTTK